MLSGNSAGLIQMVAGNTEMQRSCVSYPTRAQVSNSLNRSKMSGLKTSYRNMLKHTKHTKGGDCYRQPPPYSFLLEMAFSVFGSCLPQIALAVGNEVVRLGIQSVGDIGRVATLVASFVATCLGAVLDSTVAEVENCIFIHARPPFRKCRNFGIEIV